MAIEPKNTKRIDIDYCDSRVVVLHFENMD